MLDLVDTHCHIHELAADRSPTHDRWLSDAAERTPDSVISAAHASAVNRMICIGTTLADSDLATKFALNFDETWASIGIHPHEASLHLGKTIQDKFSALVASPKVVAVGECGLDYYYGLSPKSDQEKLLRFQIELALTHNLPLSFHVREAYDDFWPIFDSYKGVRGVIHSFTDDESNLENALSRGLYVGVNGIVTFSKNSQSVIYRTIPIDRLLLETDAPYLTPIPYRGKVCEPKHVRNTAEFLSELRGESLDVIARSTTANAQKLFNL